MPPITAVACPGEQCSGHRLWKRQSNEKSLATVTLARTKPATPACDEEQAGACGAFGDASVAETREGEFARPEQGGKFRLEALASATSILRDTNTEIEAAVVLSTTGLMPELTPGSPSSARALVTASVVGSPWTSARGTSGSSANWLGMPASCFGCAFRARSAFSLAAADASSVHERTRDRCAALNQTQGAFAFPTLPETPYDRGRGFGLLRRAFLAELFTELHRPRKVLGRLAAIQKTPLSVFFWACAAWRASFSWAGVQAASKVDLRPKSASREMRSSQKGHGASWPSVVYFSLRAAQQLSLSSACGCNARAHMCLCPHST